MDGLDDREHQSLIDRLLDVGHGFESEAQEKSALQSNEVQDDEVSTLSITDLFLCSECE